MTRDELRVALAQWKRVNDEISAAIDALSVTHADVDRWVASGFCPDRLADHLRALAGTPVRKLRGARITAIYLDEARAVDAESRVKELEAKLEAAESRLTHAFE